MSDQFPLLVQFTGNHRVHWEPSCSMGTTVCLLYCLQYRGGVFSNVIIIYRSLYLSDMCSCREPAHQIPSTAPPLPCESHPAQRLSITLHDGKIIMQAPKPRVAVAYAFRM